MASKTPAQIAKDKAAAVANLKLSNAALLKQMQTQTPWIYATYMSPDFTPAMKATLLQWAKESAAGYPPTAEETQAQTYKWPMTQLWSATQSSKFQESFTNPGQYKSELATTQAAVDAQIQASGNKVDQATRDKIVNDVFLQGWSQNDPRIAQLIAGKYDSTKATTGSALNASDQVKSIASAYMMPITSDVLNKWAGALQSGTATTDDITKYFKDQAAGQYQFMAGSIDHITPSDWFAPAKTLISNNLEIPSSQIDFNDPSGKWLGLVTTKDPKTGATIARSNSDIVKEMRTNPVYGYDNTQGAKDAAFSLGSQIRSMMGYGA